MALQLAVEKIILHALTYFREQTGEKNLALAGGVAHNCSANGKLLYSGLFEGIFVQPAAHDAGTALGAADQALLSAGVPIKPAKLRHVFFGSPIGDDTTILEILGKWSAFFQLSGATTSRH